MNENTVRTPSDRMEINLQGVPEEHLDMMRLLIENYPRTLGTMVVSLAETTEDTIGNPIAPVVLGMLDGGLTYGDLLDISEMHGQFETLTEVDGLEDPLIGIVQTTFEESEEIGENWIAYVEEEPSFS